jgi:hypothetical protein
MMHCDPAHVSAQTLMTAQRNGVLWNTRSIKGSLSPIDSLTINATSAQLQTYPVIKLDSLAIKIAYTSTGSYKLAGNQVFYATFNQNGALNSYNLDNTFDNEITISSYQAPDNPYMTNTNAVEIKGTFNIKFIDPNNPAGISFSNGNFYFIVNQQ